ncbi:ion transporter [Candidatus Poribacteria bacterium]|jgi:voltage-gated potassium channel|nr:ion transporter [Candidatus Poribacteria bacterium]MBT5709880.1 ion transporter [Candidatus Poribacteria bacterium]MBT7098798.1 ion transporter [Candidatus Poribacteria bacterium]MBT7805769.1 ion transporter [Candidatus Poribacteria bacterium]
MASNRWVALRDRTHEVLEKAASPEDWLSKAADIALVTLIIGNLAAVSFETLESVYTQFAYVFEAFEKFSVAVFSAEYVLRVWAAASEPRYANGWRGRLRYMVSLTAIVDLVAVLPTYFPAAIVDLRTVRTLRLFRLLRLMKVGRYSRSAQTLMYVMTTKKEELYTAIFAQLVLISVASSLMYFVEHPAQPEVFASVPHAMWWGVSTLTRVGYGDIYPITALGKVLGSFVSILGVAFIAMPVGIIGSGFVQALEGDGRDPRYCRHCGEKL